VGRPEENLWMAARTSGASPAEKPRDGLWRGGDTTCTDPVQILVDDSVEKPCHAPKQPGDILGMATARACGYPVEAPARDPPRKRTRRVSTRSLSENAVIWFDYFRELLTVVILVLIAVPTPFTAPMIAIAMPAAINAYSMAVAADSSLKNAESTTLMTLRPASSHIWNQGNPSLHDQEPRV
jgi:hypothetical protein